MESTKLRIVALGGEPAVGKTTIFKLLRERFTRPLMPFQYGLVRGLSDRDMKVLFIGVYDGSTWEGCDRLSMAVQPDFEKMLTVLKDKRCTIYVEGDRLFNPSLFSRWNIEGLIIVASESVVSKRHEKREDSQSKTFIKAKRTKLRRMAEQFKIQTMTNEDDEQQKQIVDYLFAKSE